MTKVTGAWTSVDTYVSFKNTKLNYGQNGPTKYTGCTAGSCTGQNKTLTVGASSFSDPAPASWVPITKFGSYSKLGATQTATCYDSSSSWTFTFTNGLF